MTFDQQASTKDTSWLSSGTHKHQIVLSDLVDLKLTKCQTKMVKVKENSYTCQTISSIAQGSGLLSFGKRQAG